MKKVRFTEEQMVTILREADKNPVAEVSKKHKIKCLTIIDEFTRKCHAIDVAGSIRSAHVIAILTRLISTHGAPAFLRSDNVLNASQHFLKGNSDP